MGAPVESRRVTSRTAAIRYARALFDVAVKERGDLELVETELAAFARLFDEHPMLGRVLLNPAVPAPRKRAAVAALTAGLLPVVSKLLVLLAERDRLLLLPDLLSSYRDRLLDHQHVVRAEVTSATPLSKELADGVTKRLAQVTGRRVIVSARVDPSIIGGLVARIGSTVYDASIARQLEKIRNRLAGEGTM